MEEEEAKIRVFEADDEQELFEKIVRPPDQAADLAASLIQRHGFATFLDSYME